MQIRFRRMPTMARMDEPKQGHPHTSYESEHPHKPYWKRIHHDWKFWIAIGVMLIAMLIYVETNDLSLKPGSPPAQRVP
jgi:hypothetical protein